MSLSLIIPCIFIFIILIIAPLIFSKKDEEISKIIMNGTKLSNMEKKLMIKQEIKKNNETILNLFFYFKYTIYN